MVVGKTLVAVTALVRAIAGREVRRRYLAIAHGKAPAAPFSVEAPIGRDPQMRLRMAVVASGKPARTDVERIATDDALSALRCTLHTGRTHQIRVHLASRGLPLVGDRLYGGRPVEGIERQALHAAELAFAHPLSGRPLAFASPLPADLAPAWRQLDRFAGLMPAPAASLTITAIRFDAIPRRAAILPPPERSTRPSRPDRTRVCISTTGQRLRTGPAAFQT